MASHHAVHNRVVSPFPTGPEIRIGSHLAKSLGTPLGDRLLGSLRKRNFADIFSMTVNPGDYTCPDLFRRDYLAVSLFSKYPHPTGVSDPAEACFSKFLKNEERCRDVNDEWFYPHGMRSGVTPANAIIFMASRKIASVLDDIDWPKVFTYVRPTSGASTRMSRRKGDVYYKVQGKPDVTPNCWLRAVQLICSMPVWHRAMVEENGKDPRNWFTVVPGNHVDTVPKKGDEHRTIGLEPEMNMLLQRAYGLYLRERLLRVGIDLRTQVRNQRAARRGARWGHYATVDFSSASDLNAYVLPLVLLSPAHFDVLDVTRSPMGSLLDPSTGEPVKWFKWEKIASMGNGWCFELETLMFWAIAEATCEYMGGKRRRCLVYGDDVIIPSAFAPAYLAVMSLFGHKPNVQKTFISGPFRESCGKHYFDRVDVTPIYIKRPIITTSASQLGQQTYEEIELYKLANRIRKWAAMPTPGYADGRYYGTWDLCVSLAKAPCFVPDGVGDVGFATTFSEAAPRTKIARPRAKDCKVPYYGYLSVPGLTDVSTKTKPLTDVWAYVRYGLYNGMKIDRLSESFSIDLPLHVVRESLRYSTSGGGFWTPGISSTKVALRKVKVRVEQWVDAPLWCI